MLISNHNATARCQFILVVVTIHSYWEMRTFEHGAKLHAIISELAVALILVLAFDASTSSRSIHLHQTASHRSASRFIYYRPSYQKCDASFGSCSFCLRQIITSTHPIEVSRLRELPRCASLENRSGRALPSDMAIFVSVNGSDWRYCTCFQLVGAYLQLLTR